MTKDQATKRPWKYDPDNGFELIKNKDGNDICVVSFPMVRQKGYDLCAQEQTANARLIVKAVNMHEELIQLLKKVESVMANNEPLLNAISKAIGEENACNLQDDITEIISKSNEG